MEAPLELSEVGCELHTLLYFCMCMTQCTGHWGITKAKLNKKKKKKFGVYFNDAGLENLFRLDIKKDILREITRWRSRVKKVYIDR